MKCRIVLGQVNDTSVQILFCDLFIPLYTCTASLKSESGSMWLAFG